MAITEPIRSKEEVKNLAQYFLERKEPRNYALIVLGVSTALRVSDLLKLRWRDVYDFENKTFYKLVQLIEKKTGKSKVVTINGDALRALYYYWARSVTRECPDAFLFAGPSGKPISRIQAYRLIKKGSQDLGMEHVSCHSLRKTFGYHAWKKHAPLAVIMDIYNHSSLVVTQRYLGVAQDDRERVYKNMCFFPNKKAYDAGLGIKSAEVNKKTDNWETE